MAAAADVQAFFDEATHTVSYLVSDPGTRQAAIVDPAKPLSDRRTQFWRRRSGGACESSGFWKPMCMPIT